jgi:hypothetical protein
MPTDRCRRRGIVRHRGGVVTKFDAANGILELRFPSMKMFIVREGEEVELHQEILVEAGTEIMMRLVVRVRQFKIGEPLKLSTADFDEIAFACSHFGAVLAQRLPKTASRL